jgi:adenine-specific DNA-methyltransferase
VINATTVQRFPEHFRDRLLFGDCVERMKAIPANSVKFILTDPPYVARYVDRSGRCLKNDDNHAWLTPAFAEAFRVLRSDGFLVSFYGWSQVDKFFAAWRSVGFRPAGHFIAPKRYTSGKRFLKYQHEQAYLLTKGSPALPADPISDILPWEYTGNRWHPTEKPLCTLIRLIQAFSAPGDVVLDPFAGSAATLAAAMHERRHYCGIEIDRRYYDLGRRRLAALGHRNISAA